MSKMIKYAVECESLYNVVALFMICTLIGFIAWLCYKAMLTFLRSLQYIVDKVTFYKEIHTKAQYNDASIEVDLHERNQ